MSADRRIKVIVPIPMDVAGVASRAAQLPADFVRPGFWQRHHFAKHQFLALSRR